MTNQYDWSEQIIKNMYNYKTNALKYECHVHKDMNKLLNLKKCD